MNGFLVCAPATAEFTTPGSIFDHHCSRCRQRVMLATSGQKILKEKPALVIICAKCYLTDESLLADADIRPAGPIEQMLDDLFRRRPNPFLRRN